MNFDSLKKSRQQLRDLRDGVRKVRDVVEEAKTFTQHEPTYTPEEVAAKKVHLQESGKLLGIALGAGILGSFALVALLVVVLDLILPLWLALLVVTGGLVFAAQHYGRKGWDHLQAGKDVIGHLVTTYVKDEIRQRKDTHVE